MRRMYRTICCELWTDPKVQSLSVPSTYLFLYLITNTHSHLSGLYYLPIPVMQLETRLGRGTDGALKGLLAVRRVGGRRGGTRGIISASGGLTPEKNENIYIIHSHSYSLMEVA